MQNSRQVRVKNRQKRISQHAPGALLQAGEDGDVQLLHTPPPLPVGNPISEWRAIVGGWFCLLCDIGWVLALRLWHPGDCIRALDQADGPGRRRERSKPSYDGLLGWRLQIKKTEHCKLDRRPETPSQPPLAHGRAKKSMLVLPLLV